MSDPRSGKQTIRGMRATAARQTTLEYDLDSAFDLFYGVKQSLRMRDRTLADYKNHWRYFREWLDDKYPDISLNEITQTVLRKYVIYMSNERTKYEGVENRESEGKNLSPTTVAIRLRSLRTMFKFWTEEGLFDVNPAEKLRPPKEDEEEIESFTDEQIRLLLAEPDDRTFAGFRDKVLMMLLADTGLRINEAVNLTTFVVDFKARCLYISSTVEKTRKTRVVPVSVDVIRLLLELVNENKAYFDTEHIFITNYGEALKADHFRKRLREYGERAGISEQVRVSPHTFRHYFCKTYLLNGGDLFTLQRIVGHKNITTTRKYIQMDDENVKEQHAQFSPINRLGRSRIPRR